MSHTKELQRCGSFTARTRRERRRGASLEANCARTEPSLSIKKSQPSHQRSSSQEQELPGMIIPIQQAPFKPGPCFSFTANKQNKRFEISHWEQRRRNSGGGARQFTQLQNQNINDTLKPAASNNDGWIQYAGIIPSGWSGMRPFHLLTQ